MSLYIIPSSLEGVAAIVATSVSAVAQELVVLTVFLLSYTLWRYLGAVSKQQRLARKLKDTGYRVSVPSRHYRDVPSSQINHTQTDVSTKEAEAEMMKHLEQNEFTRALNLYRNLERDGRKRSFSEEFYSSFVQSAGRVGKIDVVERLFSAMKRSGMVPSREFWQRVLKLLSSRKLYSTCLSAHSQFSRQMPTDKVVLSCLTNAALALGEPQRASNLLDRYAETDLHVSDHVLFFRTYLALKDADAAEAVFKKLGSQVSALMLNLMLLTCVNTSQNERALRLLGECHKHEDEDESVKIVDTVSYNTVIKGFARTGELTRCFECLRDMNSRDLQADDITFATILDACIEGNSMDKAGEIVALSQQAKPMGTVMYTLLIKGLVKVNRLNEALGLCDEMQQAGARPDVITYSVLIKALIDQRDLERALQLVEDMGKSGHKPDDIILTHLLEGCRHVGDLQLGRKLFQDVLATGVKPSEFSLVTMLKLHGRVGAHQESYKLLAGWEAAHGYKPSVIHYTCVMSGCLRTKNYDLAWSAYELMQAQHVRPDSTTLSTLLPGMVASQKWDRVMAVAREALGPLRHKIPVESLNNALAQMQAARGQTKRATELRELMEKADVPFSQRRAQSTAQAWNRQR